MGSFSRPVRCEHPLFCVGEKFVPFLIGKTVRNHLDHRERGSGYPTKLPRLAIRHRSARKPQSIMVSCPQLRTAEKTGRITQGTAELRR